MRDGDGQRAASAERIQRGVVATLESDPQDDVMGRLVPAVTVDRRQPVLHRTIHGRHIPLGDAQGQLQHHVAAPGAIDRRG